MVLALESRIQEAGFGIFLQVCHVSQVPCEEPQRESLDCSGDASVIGMPADISCRPVWNQPKREKCTAVDKAGRS